MDWLAERVLEDTPKAVINDNDLFSEWIQSEYTLDEAIRYCPSILTDLFEALNNQWIQAVEDACSEAGVYIDDDFDVIEEELDEEDEE